LVNEKEECFMTADNSRRDFVRDSVIALATLPALGAVSALAGPPPSAQGVKLSPAVQGSFKLSRNNIAVLSNSLYNSPAARQKFLADPKGFAEGLFKAHLEPADASKLANIQQMVAGGFCCQGCGCSGAPGAEISLPAVKR
jgi:hypothetical protein